MKKAGNTTEYRKLLKNKILQTAVQCFRERGIKAVTMSDIAVMLQISKRTLYEIYDNKEQLLREGLAKSFEEEHKAMANLGSNNASVMDVIIEFCRMRLKELSRTSTQFYVDLQMYPEVIKLFEQQKHNKNEDTKAFFERGQEQGYFRKDVDYNIIVGITENGMQRILEQGIYKRRNLRNIFKHTLLLFVRGLCTEKGIKELDTFLDNYPNC